MSIIMMRIHCLYCSCLYYCCCCYYLMSISKIIYAKS